MKLRSHSLFTIAVILIMALAVWEAKDWPLRASILILVLGSAGVVIGIIQLVQESRTTGGIKGSGMDIEMDEELSGAKAIPRTLTFSAWLFGLLAGIWLVGFTVSIPLYSILYSRLNGARWLIAVIIAVINFVFLQGIFEQIIHVPWPDPFLTGLIADSNLLPDAWVRFIPR